MINSPRTQADTDSRITEDTPTISTHAIATNNTTAAESSTWPQILCDLFKQAGPNAARGAAVAGRYLLTAYFLGKIDERLLAPNTLISLLESMLVVLGSRSLNVASSEIGRLNGLGQPGDIGAVVRQATVLATCLSLPICASYYFANHHFLHLVGQHEFAVEEARKYFQAAAPGFLALMLFTVQQRFFQGLKYAYLVLLSSFIHSALIVGFSYLFMFGKIGLPKLALTGAGYAFTAATWLTLIVHTLCLLFAKSLHQYNIFKTSDTFNFGKILSLARVGIPSGIQCAMENGANILNSIFLGRIGGLDALKADQISLQVAQVVSIANNGLGGAINPCISNALGKKQYDDLRRHGVAGMLMGIVLPSVAIALLIPFHKTFTHIFINTNDPSNASIVTLAKSFLLFECLRQFTTGLQVTTSSALQGLKDTKYPMIATIGCAFFVNLGLLFYLADVKHASLETVYASKAVGFFLAAIFNVFRWIMKSHEVSDADKVAIEGKSVFQRLHRGMSLLCNKQSEAVHALQNVNSLYAPLMA